MGLKILGIVLLGISILIISYQYNVKFMDWMRFQSLGTRDYIVEKLGMMFIEVDSQKVLIGLFALSFGLGTIVFLAFLPKLFPGIPFALAATAIGWKSPKPIVDWMYQRRVRKFVSQMVDALSLMSNGLKSGLSVVQSLGLVAQEMPNPIHQEFNLILSENKLGVSLEEAFSNLAQRTKVENKIAALTAQGFYQGVFVMMIPPILGGVFYQTDPEFMSPLFSTPIGWVIIMVIFLLEIVGFFVIMKIVKIDV
jgi:tight adherence protein B